MKEKIEVRQRSGSWGVFMPMGWLLKYLPFVVLVSLPNEDIQFVIQKLISIGSFLPVTLEQLARERGVLWSDKTTSCMSKATQNATTAASHLLARAAGEENNQCIVHVFGGDITTSSFAMYTFSLAVFIQALALVSFSAVADYGRSLRVECGMELIRLPRK